MRQNIRQKNIIHFWVPNLFDFKGGIQVYLGDVLQALGRIFFQNPYFKDKIDIVVFDKLDKRQDDQYLEFKNFSFVFSNKSHGSLQTIFFFWKLLTSALRQRPFLILCGHLNFAPAAHLIHKLLGTPYWVFVYGIDAWDIKSPLKKRALLTADRIISISAYTRERLLKEQQLRPENVLLLPVSFSIDRFQPKTKSLILLNKHKINANQPIILTVARLAGEDRYKGYDQILRALPIIRCYIPDVHYILVGKGQDRPRIENLIKTLELGDCVTLAGFVPDEDICDYYNLCDVFAMPSKGEGFGIVYLEALACGKPTVGGNQDGAIDALCNGELGILVDPDNVEEIANTLIEILQGKSPHPILYKPEILRQRVNKIYGFSKFHANLLALLKESDLAAP